MGFLICKRASCKLKVTNFSSQSSWNDEIKYKQQEIQTIHTVDPNPRNDKYKDLTGDFYNSHIKELCCLEQKTFDGVSTVNTSGRLDKIGNTY